MNRRGFTLGLGVIAALTRFAVSPAVADGKRVALVIGNSTYRNVPTLPNPANDAADVAAALNRLGFVVTLVTNASFDQMRRGLISLGRDAAGADMAAVFFAGHGMEISGENWLIPVDAELKKDTDAANEAVSLRSAILQVSNTTSLGLVILDACRNNPFVAKMSPVAGATRGNRRRPRPYRASRQRACRLCRSRRHYRSRRGRAKQPVYRGAPCTILKCRGLRSPSCFATSATTLWR